MFKKKININVSNSNIISVEIEVIIARIIIIINLIEQKRIEEEGIRWFRFNFEGNGICDKRIGIIIIGRLGSVEEEE